MTVPYPDFSKGSHAARFPGLSYLARRLAEEPEVWQAQQALAAALVSDLGVDRAAVYSYEPGTRRLVRVVAAAADGLTEPERQVIPLDGPREPHADVARRARAYHVSPDASRDDPGLAGHRGPCPAAIVPILAGDAVIGTLYVDNCRQGAPLREDQVDALFVFATFAAGPLLARYQCDEQRRIELLHRDIVRDVVLAVTSNTMVLCDREEIEREWPMGTSLAVTREQDMAEIRQAARREAAAAGMNDERAWEFALCVSEAATNALLYGRGGRVALASREGTVRARVTDSRPGIALRDLPATVLPGELPAIPPASLGFTILNKTADRLLLNTGAAGTTVIIEMATEPPDEAMEAWNLLLEADVPPL